MDFGLLFPTEADGYQVVLPSSIEPEIISIFIVSSDEIRVIYRNEIDERSDTYLGAFDHCEDCIVSWKRFPLLRKYLEWKLTF